MPINDASCYRVFFDHWYAELRRPFDSFLITDTTAFNVLRQQVYLLFGWSPRLIQGTRNPFAAGRRQSVLISSGSQRISQPSDRLFAECRSLT